MPCCRFFAADIFFFAIDITPLRHFRAAIFTLICHAILLLLKLLAAYNIWRHLLLFMLFSPMPLRQRHAHASCR